MKGSNKHKAPSRVRYEATHPTISIRVSQEIYDQLTKLRETSGKSLGDFIREALDVQVRSTKRAHDTGFQRGFGAARARYEVAYPCSVCRKEIVIESEGEKQAVARFMNQAGWGHAACHKKG